MAANAYFDTWIEKQKMLQQEAANQRYLDKQISDSQAARALQAELQREDRTARDTQWTKMFGLQEDQEARATAQQKIQNQLGLDNLFLRALCVLLKPPQYLIPTSAQRSPSPRKKVRWM